MILGLRTVIYPSPDLGAAKSWYTEVLGITPYFDEPFYVGFNVGGFELGLVPDGIPGSQGSQSLWGVENIQSAVTRLTQLGAKPLDPIVEVGGGIKVAAVLDPSGNRLGLIENPGFDVAKIR